MHGRTYFNNMFYFYQIKPYSPVNVVIYPKQIATVMKPSFWLTIYMYKQHMKNQPKSNIWNTVKFEEQILHHFYAGQNVNMHTYLNLY